MLLYYESFIRWETGRAMWLLTVHTEAHMLLSFSHTGLFFFFFPPVSSLSPAPVLLRATPSGFHLCLSPFFFFFNNSLPDLAAASREVEKHVVARTRLCVHCRRVRRMEWGNVFLLSPSGSRQEGRLSNYVPPVSFCVMHIHVAFKVCVCVCVLSTIQVISGIINILRQVVDNESNVVLCY